MTSQRKRTTNDPPGNKDGIFSVGPGPDGDGQPPRGDAWESEEAAADFDPAAFEARAPAGETPQAEEPDLFDPASLRIDQDFSAAAGVKKALLAVPVRKPDRSWFVRVHPDPNYRVQTAVIELKEERETYLIAKPIRPELAAEATFRPKMLATAVNRQGVLFLWEVNLPRPDGKADEWSRTGLAALEMATKRWVRVTANMGLGGYDVYEALGQLSEPQWPTLPFKELLRIAFKTRLIDSLNHPVLRRLRGEV
jgi:hypothetical protein